jgi:hypothetical protein
MRDVSLRDPELYPVSAPPPAAAGSRIIAEQVIHNLSNRPTLQYHLQHTDLKGAVLPPEWVMASTLANTSIEHEWILGAHLRGRQE